jgi:hypothetical protein
MSVIKLVKHLLKVILGVTEGGRSPTEVTPCAPSNSSFAYPALVFRSIFSRDDPLVPVVRYILLSPAYL